MKPISSALKQMEINKNNQILPTPPGSTTKPDPVWEVQLTEVEAEQAIYNAKWEKYQRIKKIEAEEARKANEATFRAPWTAERYLEFIKYRMSQLNYEFIIDDHNRDLIFALCCYFTNDNRFIEYGQSIGKEWSLNKGLLLRGTPGLGKSELIKLFQANPKQSFEFIACESIGTEFRMKGDDVLYRFATFRPEVPNYRSFFQERIGSVYDDLGREDPVGHYGPAVNFMQKIIQMAYDRKNIPWYMRHATTMYNFDELQGKYGLHVRSRIREMFNDITLKGEDRRK